MLKSVSQQLITITRGLCLVWRLSSVYKGITDDTFKATLLVFVFKTSVTFLPQDKLGLETNRVTH